VIPGAAAGTAPAAAPAATPEAAPVAPPMAPVAPETGTAAPPAAPTDMAAPPAAAPAAPPAAAPAAAPAQPEEKPVDPGYLLATDSRNSPELRETVDYYIQQTHTQLGEIRQPLAKGDVPTLKRLGHKSAGSSGLCGALKLGRLMGELETVAGRNDLARAAELIPLIEKEFAKVENYLKVYFGSPS